MRDSANTNGGEQKGKPRYYDEFIVNDFRAARTQSTHVYKLSDISCARNLLTDDVPVLSLVH